MVDNIESVGRDSNRISVTTFSTDYAVYNYFNGVETESKQNLNVMLNNMNYNDRYVAPKQTYLGKLLSEIEKSTFQYGRKDNNKVEKIIVILTDGKPTDLQKATSSAQYLRVTLGYKIYVCLIGKFDDKSKNHMINLAGNVNNIIYADGFGQLTSTFASQFSSKFCAPKNCQLTNWSPWSQCENVKCNDRYSNVGIGQQTRSNALLKAGENGGKNDCKGEQQQQQCTVDTCKADCKLSEWTTWSPCPVKCPKDQSLASIEGNQTRKRSIEQMAMNGGDQASCDQAKKVDTQDCSQKCAIDCVLGDWSEYGACDGDCGLDPPPSLIHREGNKTRTRKITVEAKNGGSTMYCDTASKEQKKPCLTPCGEVREEYKYLYE
eukprot:Pgem_evm2s18248